MAPEPEGAATIPPDILSRRQSRSRWLLLTCIEPVLGPLPFDVRLTCLTQQAGTSRVRRALRTLPFRQPPSTVAIRFAAAVSVVAALSLIFFPVCALTSFRNARSML